MPMTEETRKQFEQEERAYWAQRDELLKHFSGKFVAIVDGKVAAVGNLMNKVAAEAYRITRKKVSCVTLVGDENFEIRIRSLAVGHYDTSHRHGLPMLTVEVADEDQLQTVETECIVDTGADIPVIQTSIA